MSDDRRSTVERSAPRDEGIGTGDPLPTMGVDESRAFLAAIVESSADAIVGKDLDGVIRSWNPGAERLFGYTAAEAVGRSVRMLIPPELQHQEDEILGRLRRGERIASFETVRLAKDGTRLDVSLTVSPIRSSSGEIVGASKVARDVGEEKAAERALQRSEERFRALADNIAQLAWMADREGRIFWYNRRWYEYTGTHLDEMEGWGWTKVHHPEHVDRVVERFRRSIGGGEEWEDTFPLRRADGEYRWFLSRALPIRDAAGEVTLWFGTNTDITEHMELEEALRRADRRKDEFLATLAHELRNPLAPIRNGCELLRHAGDDPELGSGVLDKMERQIDHLVRLVDDLLDVSRITRGKVALRPERLDLLDVVESAVETARPLLDAAEHRFSLETPPGPMPVWGDATRLSQAISNLLNNASKYTDPHGEISLEIHVEGEDVVVEVRDNGRGIAEERLESVFEMFSQSGEAAGSEGGGLGLGLTLVRSLVELHGGTVHAASGGPGTGSRFTVRLPLLTENPTEVEGEAEAGEPGPPDGEAGGGEAEGARLSILVVDDNRDAADSLGTLLELFGYRCRVAYDGEEALALAGRVCFDVVLLDLGMPGLGGIETARGLRERPGGDRLVLVALTGWGQDADRERTREAGFDHHLVKPASVEQLRELLGRIPGRRAS